MMTNNKDKQILQHILAYCDEINLTIKSFGKSKSKFLKDFIYVNAISMPIMQIGELSKKISDDVKMELPDIPWKQIAGIRNIFAHAYHSMDKEVIWETATTDIPALQATIKRYMKNNHIEALKSSQGEEK